MRTSVSLKLVSCSAHLESAPLHWESFELPPTNGACDEAAGADDDLWHLDEVGLSSGESFDEGCDERLDKGLCDERFNEK